MNSLYWQLYSGCRGCSLDLNSVNIGKYIFLNVILKLELRTFKRREKPRFYVWYKFGQNKSNGLALDEQIVRKALESGTFLGNYIQNPRWLQGLFFMNSLSKHFEPFFSRIKKTDFGFFCKIWVYFQNHFSSV